jgi:hypothetical protein
MGANMPQASRELQERWGTDWNAIHQLRRNFTQENGIIRPMPGYTPTEEDLSAVDYLVAEWDYGYEGA